MHYVYGCVVCEFAVESRDWHLHCLLPYLFAFAAGVHGLARKADKWALGSACLPFLHCWHFRSVLPPGHYVGGIILHSRSIQTGSTVYQCNHVWLWRSLPSSAQNGLELEPSRSGVGNLSIWRDQFPLTAPWLASRFPWRSWSVLRNSF